MKTNKNKIERNPNYAVAYARFSSDRQRDESIEAQERAIKIYAEQNDITILEYYEDRAQSAKDDNRTAFQRMVKEMKTSQCGKILVHKMDRFSRNILQFLQYEKDFNSMGVEIVYVAQPEMNNKFVKMIYAAMAEQFLDNLSYEATKGMIINAEKGKRNGGVAPYGYTLKEKKDSDGNTLFTKNGHKEHFVVINPEQAEAVKLMFQMTIDGHTRAEIIDTLTQKGFRKATKQSYGKPFTGTAIDNILRNERYTGEYDFHYNVGTREKPVYEAKRVCNEFPAIISKETFEKVQKLLSTRKHRQPCNSEEEYLLTGKIVCGECGAQYNGMRCKRHGKMYVYYKCVNQSSYKNGQVQKTYCHNNSVQKDLLESAVIEKLKKVVFNENFIPQVFDEYNKYVKSQSLNSAMIEVLNKKIEEIEKGISSLLDVISNGYSSSSVLERLKTLENEKIETQQRLQEEMQGSNYIPATIEEVAKVYRKARETLDGNDFYAKRRIVNNFVNKIIVYKNKAEIYINLIPTICCATLDLDILKTHLFSGELKYGEWELETKEKIKDLCEYNKLCERPNARYRAHFDNVIGEKTILDCGSYFTTDNQSGQPNYPRISSGDFFCSLTFIAKIKRKIVLLLMYKFTEIDKVNLK